MRLSLNQIRLDGGTQPRTALNVECIARYERDMREGVQFDPIEVVYDGAEYWCWDGFHRCNAARRAGLQDIEANITQGTLDDAQWLSVGANKRHGLPRSNADKMQAVCVALRHPMGAELSDGAIAEHVGVSQPFVGKVRRSIAATHNGFVSPARTGRDGRTINTAKIGKGKRRDPHVPSRRMAARVQKPTRVPSPMEKMTALTMPHNPVMGARTLIEVFDADYLRILADELSSHLKGIER